MERITVVKIGGNVIDNPAALKRFLGEFAALEGPKILVHGGGKLATRLAERLELKVQMVDGRRITDKGTLDVVTMVYAGLINKQVADRLGIGLTTVISHRRNIMEKLGIRTTAGLVVYALAAGYVDPDGM